MDQRDRMFAVMGVVAVLVSAGLGTAFAVGIPDQDGGGLEDLVAIWFVGGTRTRTEVGLNTDVIEFEVTEHNLTELTVRLTWQDDELISPIGRRDDILTLTVEGPSDLAMEPQTAAGTTGEVVLSFDLATIPVEEDPDLFADYDYQDATGTWTVTVSVQAQGFRDTGNDWSVSLSYTYYMGDLVEAPGAE